jgi:hypothetical protein
MSICGQGTAQRAQIINLGYEKVNNQAERGYIYIETSPTLIKNLPKSRVLNPEGANFFLAKQQTALRIYTDKHRPISKKMAVVSPTPQCEKVPSHHAAAKRTSTTLFLMQALCGTKGTRLERCNFMPAV